MTQGLSASQVKPSSNSVPSASRDLITYCSEPLPSAPLSGLTRVAMAQSVNRSSIVGLHISMKTTLEVVAGENPDHDTVTVSPAVRLSVLETVICRAAVAGDAGRMPMSAA